MGLEGLCDGGFDAGDMPQAVAVFEFEFLNAICGEVDHGVAFMNSLDDFGVAAGHFKGAGRGSVAANCGDGLIERCG